MQSPVLRQCPHAVPSALTACSVFLAALYTAHNLITLQQTAVRQQSDSVCANICIMLHWIIVLSCLTRVKSAHLVAMWTKAS